MKKNKVQRRKGIKTGRPTKFKEEFIAEVQKYAMLSLTHKEMALLLSNEEVTITDADIKSWIKRIPSFASAVKKGSAKAKSSMVGGLYNAGMRGNVTAMIFWLCNRYPEEWRNLHRSSVEATIHDKREEQKESRKLLQALLQPSGENGKLLVEKLQEEYIKAGGDADSEEKNGTGTDTEEAKKGDSTV